MTERVTRPPYQVAAGAKAIAGGAWTVSVPADSKDEIGDMARAFNVTHQLIEHRELNWRAVWSG